MAALDDKVSVCLPIFNGAKYLGGAIESVLAQSHGNFELLIADDLSSDSSPEIAQQYAGRDPRIVYWRNETNRGIFANYNECLKRVSGSYVKLFAQDDILEPACLARLLEQLRFNPNLALVTAARAVIDENGEETAIERFFTESVVIPGRKVISDYMRTFTYRTGTPAQVMFRSNSVGDGFNTKYTLSGDIEYFYRILEAGDYMYLDEVLVKFRRHGDSATVTSLKDMSFVADTLRLTEKFASYEEEERIEEPILVRGALIEGLIKKVNNAVYDRKLELNIKSLGSTAGSAKDEDLRYERLACELLFYAAKTKMQMEEVERKLRRQEQAMASQNGEEKSKAQMLESELKVLKEQLADLKQSRSWKITQPIRWLGRVLQQ